MPLTEAPIVPFNRAYITGVEQQYMTTAIMNGLLEGDGPFTRRANALVAEIVGASAALLTTSCTHALEMSALLLDLVPGDEVIVPSFTFVSTATAIALRGAVPVFVDCRPDTLNLDERRIEAAVTPRTRAIVVVHYAGVACEMDAVMAIAGRYGLAVVEDNAHGLGGRYKGRPLGSFGTLAAQSFHATKNVQCGEGGALVVNDATLIERAEIIREKGTNRSQFFRGMTDKYRWVENGSSYLPSDILAAFLVAQLEAIDDIQRRRHRIWNAYDERLADWAGDRGVGRPTVPDGCAHPAHLYYLLLPDLPSRQSLLRHLAERGVRAAFHYQPLHTAPGGLRYGRVAPGGCPVTEDVADRIIRLPLFAEMSDTELDLVVESITSFSGPTP
ncbi:dTDP-4-amino-4,6-dideoxygalactose transaminase [Actinoallomurus sp. NPDC052274]|uniref:dTDP-4-amino-4,6-dideoxygalactose transaminase n=1 Tax=Actinoallomurus sp. NPDC052274 TaxID=3155420 RepID=UPI003415E557